MTKSRNVPPAAELTYLDQILRCKKHGLKPARLHRLKAMGRVVDIPGRPPPLSTPLPKPDAPRTQIPTRAGRLRKQNWRRLGERVLFLIEIALVFVFVVTVASLWLTNGALNRKVAAIQRAAGVALALPTGASGPVIDVVILPGGHRPPVAGTTPEPGEAGYIPPHLLPAINSYVAPPAPTRAPEHARRIHIDAIDVDSAIYQGMYDWEVLKKGVAQHIGSAAPGQEGSMVLAGHNDVYGEVFRYLDQLTAGDEIHVNSERQAYTYVVRESIIVEPTAVWVLEPTEYASLTLISCYPYRVNTKRIVVFADLAS